MSRTQTLNVGGGNEQKVILRYYQTTGRKPLDLSYFTSSSDRFIFSHGLIPGLDIYEARDKYMGPSTQMKLVSFSFSITL